MPIIPFYGADRPDLFAIERRAMDPAGRVIAALDRRLPQKGLVADIGAGDGHAAAHLATGRRMVVAVEPSAGMIRPDRPLPWLRADAVRLPFRDGAFDAAYATWAYFFTRDWDPSPGLAELHRVVGPGGPLLIVDNLGGDDFSALAPSDITADPGFWSSRGFSCEVIDTWFEFDDLDEARTLLGFYFGEAGRDGAARRLSFRVGLFAGRSAGAGRAT